jgi:uncharacterized membrane protein
MKYFSNLFLRGLMTLLPAMITLAILVSFLAWTEDLSKRLITVLSADYYIPGLGPAIGILLICFLGYLTTLKFMSRILLTLELPFKNVPIIKSIYSAFKSLSDYFNPNKSTGNQQVVVVNMPGFPAQFVGLVTRQSMFDLPEGLNDNTRVAVYMPLSYAFGGMTIFVPRTWVTKIDMKVEDAMKSALTAWMPQ